MFAPYDKAQIRDFAQTSLSFIGSFTDAEQRAHRRDFMRAVSLLPPWQQVLMIEGGGTNVATTRAIINKVLEVDKGNHVGAFVPEEQITKISPTEEFRSVNGIFWAVDNGCDPLPAIYHEQGHRIDMAMGERFCAKQKHHYFSENSEPWTNGLNNQLLLTGRVGARGRLEAILGKSKQSAAYVRVYERDMDDSVPLYKGYTRLADHLKFYKDRSEHKVESFAEMNAHYCMLHGKMRGNELAVDRQIGGHLPALWPVFRDSMIAKAQELAEELLIKHERGRPMPRP